MRGHDTGGWGRWFAVSVLVAVAAIFSFLNAGERVSIDVGFTTLYRISLVGLVFGSFLLGMVAMFLFGLRHDRRVREALRQREARERRADFFIERRRTEEPPI